MATPTGPGPAHDRLMRVEVTLAVVAFAALCVLVLSVAPQSAEPDDGVTRIDVAMTEGHS